MTCPHCGSEETSRRSRCTSLGYRTSACRACHRIFNERTGTPFNELQYPTDIVLLAVLWRLRHKLGFRDVDSPAARRPRKRSREGGSALPNGGGCAGSDTQERAPPALAGRGATATVPPRPPGEGPGVRASARPPIQLRTPPGYPPTPIAP